MDLHTLNRLLEFSMMLRRRGNLLTFSALRELLRSILRGLGEVLQCRVAYGGSVSLFLQGISTTFGDIDVITDREWMPEDLPWAADWRSQLGLKVEAYDLDIMFNRGYGDMMWLANRHIVELADGFRVQDATFIRSINRIWIETGCKVRLCADVIEPELERTLRRCLHRENG